MKEPTLTQPSDPEDIYADQVSENAEFPDFDGIEYDYELEQFYRSGDGLLEE